MLLDRDWDSCAFHFGGLYCKFQTISAGMLFVIMDLSISLIKGMSRLAHLVKPSLVIRVNLLHP